MSDQRAPLSWMSQAEMRAYHPTWRERAAQWLMDRGPGSAESDYQPSVARQNFVSGLLGSTGVGQSGIGLLDFVPLLGGILGSQEAVQAGDYQGAALGAIPAAKPVKKGAGLAMDTASRMARADAMGFRRDLPLYHGTGQSFDAFRAVPTSGGGRGDTGEFLVRDGWALPGISLSLDPKIANDFALSAKTNPRVLNQDHSPQIHKVFHRADNPTALTLTGNEKHHEVVATLQDAFDRGYDSVMLRNYISPEGKVGDIVIVRDANQLRSPQAAFDPKKRDSGNLLAGIAPLGFAGALGLAARDENQ